ncbi:MAG: methylenetetrahydrofolate--tRNA-(uracil(54)-C(5))-methyltransferase (FADH(2)-oxidizing) TrmFO [Clostridiales bacterium]|nr:methylenetetrahydrofolate--tRNA-(uracil(54)-C(5))-methyltransferase (FADH(2)-oxidizing) TrmFO [Clostridiales bacterium]
MKNKNVTIIGGGLAGCEAALYLANAGVSVTLYEMKKVKKTPAQKSEFLAELVCSNSLKATDTLSASGLLKLEMEKLGSHLLPLAYDTCVPSGGALSVDREQFGQVVTKAIYEHPLIKVVDQVVTQIDTTKPCIVACGPLIDGELFNNLKTLIGDDSCYFYDAIAPIITAESIDMNYAYWGNRYNKGETADYLNCLMNKEEYFEFYNQLINAKTVELHEFEKLKVFEGCMPVEIMAKRGIDALRYGPMKPVGLRDERFSERPYAAIQLRKEDLLGDNLNMVGFQTNLTFPEQKRVFGLVPALKNAEFIRYGTMHRNSYINAPKCMNEYSQLKQFPNVFIAGQLSGVEGYVESMASGLYVAINMLQYLNQKPLVSLPSTTVLGAIQNYIAFASEKDFQPMNANYGIVQAENMRDKEEKKRRIKEKSLEEINNFLNKIKEA